MEKVLKLYTYVDGVNDTPFPSESLQVLVTDFRCDYKRMGGAPTISCSVIHPNCLDKLWTYNVYALFNGERFFIKQIPTSSYDNTDFRYKHELELVSERIILDNVYFYDVVDSEADFDKPVSNSSSFTFFGDIHEFAKRLNESLVYSKVGYSVVVDEGISSEAKLLSFQDQFFTNVLQEIYNTYEIPYYFVGKTIHIGFTNNVITKTFKYGDKESLLSIQKQNANYKIVNRVTGVGSADNIPYYYPNFDNKGVTEVLYNGETGKVNIVDANKYSKIKLNDVFLCNMYKADDESLLDNSFFTDINFTYTDDESQYGIEFYYKFTIKETCNIRLYLKTTYQNSEDIFCDLYNENKNYIGYFKDGDVVTNLPQGSYRIKVTWNIVSPEPMTRPLAEQLVIEYVSVNAIIIGETTYWWSLNGKNIKLSDYGISLSVAPSVGDEISVRQLSYIKPSANLMPSIYRESLGTERFYKALNNTYKMPNSNEYYEFENPYIDGKPKEHIVKFDDIKPTIVGMTNAEGLRIDMFSDFAFDENDNDEFDEEGNYIHPYFFGKLRKFDGEYGFNLFDHSIEESEMTISMTSGSCGACEFVIGVDDKTQKNLVQVDEDGNLLRDKDGNVRCGRQGMQVEIPQDKQNDTINNEVWIALKKDQDTFGVLMPNAENKYRPQAEDTFVILHIDLPMVYVFSAENKLKEELIKYMALNNSEKFNFSISFSRIFFAENPNILANLNENARIKIEYDNERYELYVSSFSYSMASNTPLPEIRVELKDTLTITQNTLQNAISDVKSEIFSTIGNSANVKSVKLNGSIKHPNDKGIVDLGIISGGSEEGVDNYIPLSRDFNDDFNDDFAR